MSIGDIRHWNAHEVQEWHPHLNKLRWNTQTSTLPWVASWRSCHGIQTTSVRQQDLTRHNLSAAYHVELFCSAEIEGNIQRRQRRRRNFGQRSIMPPYTVTKSRPCTKEQQQIRALQQLSMTPERPVRRHSTNIGNGAAERLAPATNAVLLLESRIDLIAGGTSTHGTTNTHAPVTIAVWGTVVVPEREPCSVQCRHRFSRSLFSSSWSTVSIPLMGAHSRLRRGSRSVQTIFDRARIKCVFSSKRCGDAGDRPMEPVPTESVCWCSRPADTNENWKSCCSEVFSTSHTAKKWSSAVKCNKTWPFSSSFAVEALCCRNACQQPQCAHTHRHSPFTSSECSLRSGADAIPLVPVFLICMQERGGHC